MRFTNPWRSTINISVSGRPAIAVDKNDAKLIVEALATLRSRALPTSYESIDNLSDAIKGAL